MEARNVCDKVLEETPAVAKAWFRRGEANFALNDWEVAKVGGGEAGRLWFGLALPVLISYMLLSPSLLPFPIS